MWNSREESKSVPTAAQPVKRQEQPPMACIGQSVIIKGDVSSAEDLTIDGRVEGKIEVGDHNLTVGVGASITADLVANAITISGVVNGNVTARERIELREQGSVDGDLTAPRIAMREGAFLRGHVDTLHGVQADARARFSIAI